MEVETVGKNYESLIGLADVVFISKDVSRSNGADNLQEAIALFSDKLKPEALLVCTWGDKGAAGCLKGGKPCFQPAYPPAKLVDTCGAGDTFTASVIVALIKGYQPEDALKLGCKVAGAKVGQRGLTGLAREFNKALDQQD